MNQKIQHSFLLIRGLKLHIAHIGKGFILNTVDYPVPIHTTDSLSQPSAGEIGTLLFVHGFPEVWYSWRHQMVAAAAAGFRAIAPDFPGYGLSEPPTDLAQASWEALMKDLLAILDSLSISKAFLVAKDFGVKPAFDLALCHPDRVCGVVTIGVPPLVESLDFSGLPEGFYIYRWRVNLHFSSLLLFRPWYFNSEWCNCPATPWWEPGRAEGDFGRFNARRIMRTIYILFSKSEVPVAKQGQEIVDLAEESTPLPDWFTEEDLSAYTALYEKSGFITALQIPYRTKPSKVEYATPKFQMPMFVIMGERDYILKFPALHDYISSQKLKDIAPEHEISYISEGSHFVQEQFPDLVNHLMIDFLSKLL
ncbi:hypothetical protein PR202_gb23812 [Eleusine coracana subsp. coracana]|uniref:AB hydrolase-1 domain-containing protein n=1 Tax=Eleusine coracana subsp. coracana TaxID=191504 RepID=A0AAV5FH52_ELECO|nr:hypothetical protein PR202_gb23812 [Eleusine coracana subsp. coracana]